jgi:para-nitrobenzyl esterase
MELGPLVCSTSILKDLEQSENCQVLTVTVPKGTGRDARLPVMVWIHGGAFVTGTGEGAGYNPRRLVEEHGVIVVNLSYRLGLFGFIGDSKARPSNLGLLDLHEGLRWVKRNIASFGGNDDPRSITVFGESAGAAATADLMLVKDATDLFGRVILQSSPLGLRRNRAELDIALNKATVEISTSSTVEEVLGASTAIKLAAKDYGLTGAMPFSPAFGHEPLPAESEVDQVMASVAPKIDVLIGCNQNEASLYIERMSPFNYLSQIPFLGRMIYNAAEARTTGSLFHRPTDEFAKRYKQANGNVSIYRIVWAVPGNRMGSSHTIELPLLFDIDKNWAGGKMTEGADWSELEQNGKTLRGLWAGFAKGRQLGPEDSVSGLIDITLPRKED